MPSLSDILKPKNTVAVLMAVVMICIFSTTVRAEHDNSITWLIWDLPPEFISEGPLKDQGYADKFLAHFQSVLPDFEHHVQRVNIPRWSEEVLKPRRCSAHLWGGFFKDKLVLSKAYTFTPPHVLIFHKRHEERLGPPGTTLSLETLLAKDDLRLAIMKLVFNENAEQTRYPILAPYLMPYIGTEKIIEQKVQANSIDLRFLKRAGVDYTIGYPSTITTQVRVHGLKNEYIQYPLKEHNTYKNVYVACNNSEFGRDIIERINASLTDEMLLKFLGYHEEWNDRDENFRQTTIDYLIKGLKLTNVQE